jgi:DnaJ-domain-containing protein 1
MLARVFSEYFYLVQILIGTIFLLLMARYWFVEKGSESMFKLREADRVRKPTSDALKAARLLGSGQAEDDLAQARIKQPLRLTGIRIDGLPHEILGVQPSSGRSEIQKAHRELMKRYHPDLVGPPGSREWQDAQKIAEAINRAKDEMFKRLKP